MGDVFFMNMSVRTKLEILPILRLVDKVRIISSASNNAKIGEI